MRIFLTILLELERARKPGPNANAGPSLHKPRARAQFSTKLGKALNLKVTLIWFFDVVLERAQAQAHRPGLNAGPEEPYKAQWSSFVQKWFYVLGVFFAHSKIMLASCM